MKNTVKLLIVIVLVAILTGACNRYVVCPAYADQQPTTQTTTNSNS